MKKKTDLIYILATVLVIVGAVFKIFHLQGAFLVLFLGFIVGGFADRLEIRRLKNRIRELENPK